MKANLARVMESATNLSIFSHKFWIFEPCEKSKDNLIANIENSDGVITTFMLKQVIGEICIKNDCQIICFLFSLFLLLLLLFFFRGGRCSIIIINELIT